MINVRPGGVFNRASIVAVTLLSLSFLSAASAQPAPDEKEVAKQHYSMGMKLYNLGDFGKARDEFKAAYLAKEDPAFLYNIGQCDRMLGNLEEAVQRYRAYLRERPQAPNRREVEGLIKSAEKEAELHHNSKTAVTAPLAPRDEPGTATTSVPAPPPAGVVVPAPPPQEPPPPTGVVVPAPPPAVGPPPPQPQQPMTIEQEPPPAQASAPVYKKPVFWVVIGAVVVVAAVTIVAFSIPNNAAVPGNDTLLGRWQ